jgi:pyrroloquinoline quinone (PQQ) biosynthesis protein C
VEGLIARLREGTSLSIALRHPEIPEGARRFVETTFQIIASRDTPRVVAAFALGREILIPDMFRQIVQGLNREVAGRLTALLYYLDRHIELDGGEHGSAAEELLCEVCGSNPVAWQQAREGALTALEARLQLWNDISDSLDAAGSARPEAAPLVELRG